MTDVVIRRATLEDAPLLRRVRLRALATDPASFGSTYAREAAYSDDVWREWAAGGSAGDESAMLLALRGGEPVGLVTGRRDDTDRHVFHVFAMWVAPEARRTGVGRRLLDEIERWMTSSGGTLAKLSVTNEAAAARRLYESAGYEPDGQTAESRHTPGLLEIGMRKQLAG